MKKGMPAKIIDGKLEAEKVLKKLKVLISGLKKRPGLAIVRVGEDPASITYTGSKEKKAKELGFYTEMHILPKDAEEFALLNEVDELNQSEKIHGMIVQLPLPKHIDEHLVIDAILPHKDADGIGPVNMGNLLRGKNLVLPATPKGIVRLIESTGVPIKGKHAVVIGRSNIVGKPIALLLQQLHATVTMCHSQTKDLEKYTRDADILVSAAGIPGLVKKEMVKKGAIVIDVSMNRDKKGKLVGDVDFEEVKKVAGYITPVPGGVGPMTIAMLLENTVWCMEQAPKNI